MMSNRGRGSDEESSSCRGRCRHWRRGRGLPPGGQAVAAAMGATDEERDATLDGDDLIANPDLMAIRAITVHAAAAQVWPWIAQLGQGRGGFYSYDALENLVGCDLHSADRIVPQWQDLKVGDQVKLHPEVGLGVTVVEQGRALVLRGGVPMGAA